MQNAAYHLRAAQPGFDPYSGHSDTGWFGSKLAKKVSHAVSSVANDAKRGVSAAERAAVKVATAPARALPGKFGKYAAYAIAPATLATKYGAPMATNIANGAINTIQHPNIRNLVATAQQAMKATGPIGMVGAGAIGAMQAGLQGKNLESIAWAAAEGAAPEGISQAIGAAEKIRHGGSVIDIALKQAQSSFLPGTAEMVGFNSAIAALKNQASMSGLGEIRRTLNTEGAKRAFDSAIGTVSKAVKSSGMTTRANSIPNIVTQRARTVISATNPNISHVLKAIAANPGLATQDPSLLAAKFGTHKSAIIDALNRSGKKQLLPWRSLSPNAVNFVRRWHPNAPLAALRHLHTDTSGLDQTGTKYVVVAGDSPWAIAQALTGNGNRWTELKAVNTDKNPTIDKNVWTGEVLNLPTSWQKPATVAPAAPATPALPAVPLPTIAPVPSTGTPVLPTPSIDLSPSILQGKSILVAWSKTDGVNQGGLSDYGLTAADLSTSMGPRDTLELSSYQAWADKTKGESLSTAGALDPATLASLQAWAESRAAQAIPAIPGNISPLPVVIPSLPTQNPATVILPNGEQESTGASATPAVAPKTAANSSKMTAAIGGAAIGGVLFGIPGAIIGGVAGAAIA